MKMIMIQIQMNMIIDQDDHIHPEYHPQQNQDDHNTDEYDRDDYIHPEYNPEWI